MGKASSSTNPEKQLRLKVDDKGRITLPKGIQEQLGIEPDDEIPATLVGSILTINPKPSAKLETATSGRREWKDTTPTDAGDALFRQTDGTTERDD
ncbi:AbrB/MazE/SpoVT family DNA-binding domain-containing protein [Halobellus salinisoli]|uniref:AbrB/MazE/SpoVT family DNA-binding domain-containing protein n=1 Tax=Halobellus salinisoli TaxID=3108500 RepID=UPI0030084269